MNIKTFGPVDERSLAQAFAAQAAVAPDNAALYAEAIQSCG